MKTSPKKSLTQDNGQRHKIKVPGETQLYIYVARSQVIANRVMTCQVESCHIGGHFLKNIIMDEQVKMYTTKKYYQELSRTVQSETNRVKMDCEVNQGGCIGDKRTYPDFREGALLIPDSH